MWNDRRVIEWSRLLLDSYRHFLGEELIVRSDPPTDARMLFVARFVVVSHGTQADPIFNYGNQAALRLWDLHWTQLIRMLSRLTTGPVDQSERQRMLDEVARAGCIRDYHGVRLTKSGQRFEIRQAVVWNVFDRGARVGQAATFAQWTWI